MSPARMTLHEDTIRATRTGRSAARFAACVAFVLLAGQTAVADFPVELVSQWGGPCRAVGLTDNYALIGSGPSLIVLDIRDPAHPIQRGKLILPDLVQGIATSGHYAYVAAQSALQVIDLSDPAAPALVGGCALDGGAFRVAVAGTYAYVAGAKGLEIIDISNPIAPVRVGAHGAGSGDAIALDGNYAYLIWHSTGDYGDMLEVIDISKPQAPVYVASYHGTGGALKELPLPDTTRT